MASETNTYIKFITIAKTWQTCILGVILFEAGY